MKLAAARVADDPDVSEKNVEICCHCATSATFIQTECGSRPCSTTECPLLVSPPRPSSGEGDGGSIEAGNKGVDHAQIAPMV